MVQPKLATIVRRVLQQSLNVLRDSDLAEDCLQEARIHLWMLEQRLSTLPESEQEAYAVVSVQRVVRRYLRWEQCFHFRQVPFEQLCVLANLASSAPACSMDILTESDWVTTLSHVWLYNRIRALPLLDRRILHLYYCYGMTDAEVARALRRTQACVEHRRNRTIRRLRSLVSRTERNQHEAATERI
jgi:RNA polymerase sigma factor (sigma-70 family)